MAQGRLGLALGGGGSRGAYQIGVWQALREGGLCPQIVTGTSVGALNGAMIVQDDYEAARRMWLRLTARDVANVDLPEEPAAGSARAVYLEFMRQAVLAGGVDISGLESIMRQVVIPDRFYASPIDYGLVTVRIPTFEHLTLRKSEIAPESLCDYLVASASCFPAFPAKRIGGARFIDGAYYDNVPINLAIDLGAAEVIAVDLEAVGLRRRVKNRDVPVTFIRPIHPLGPTLQFEPDSAARNMRLGYLDALRALGRAEGGFVTLHAGAAEALSRRLEEPLRRTLRLAGRTPGPLRAGRRAGPEGGLAKTMQLLAQWYELDPETLYTARSYCYELLLRFNATGPDASEDIAAALRDIGGGLVERLERFGRQRLVGHLYALLREASFGRGDGAALKRMAAALQNEAAGAMLLFALKTDLADENTAPL